MAEPLGDIIIEIQTIGGSQRVSAFDTQSLIEVVFQAPLGTDRATLDRLARQKLAYRLSRAGQATPPPEKRGGRLV